jgi:hypothetical protein
MSQQMTTAQGNVTIADLVFVVQELPTESEIGLRAKLRAEARKAWGPGSFYANVLPVAKWAREQGQQQDAAQMVASVAPLIARLDGASEDAAELYRQSPDGVAWELFFRTRKTHPEADRAEFRAIVNEVNAVEVYLAILEAIAPGKELTPSNSPSG